MPRDYYEADYYDEVEYEPRPPKKTPRHQPPVPKRKESSLSRNYRKFFLVSFILILTSRKKLVPKPDINKSK